MSSNCAVVYVLIWLIYAQSVHGQKENTTMTEKIQDMDMHILNLKYDVSGLERRLSTRVELTQQYLKAELVSRIVPEYTYTQVREALANIFADRTIEDMLSGYVVQKLDALSDNFQNLRRNVHVLSRRLRDVERERDMCKKSMKNQSADFTGKLDRLHETVSGIDEKWNTTYLALRQSTEKKLLDYSLHVQGTTVQHRLLAEKTRQIENGLNETRLSFTEYNHQRDSDYRLHVKNAAEQHRLRVEKVSDLENQRETHCKQCPQNATYHYEESAAKVNKLEDGLNASRSGMREQTLKNDFMLEVSSASPTTASIPTAKDMDLLIAAHYDRFSSFQRLDLHTNSLTNFPLWIKDVHSILYVSSRRSVLISAHNPYILVYYNMDRQLVRSVRNETMVNGMALDETHQLVFMAFEFPRFTVGSMDVDGQGFRDVVDLDNVPYRISVDSRHKMIYVCVSDKLLRVEYDGHNLQTISTGAYVFAVALDLPRDLLYFNDAEAVITASLNGTGRKQMFQLDFIPSSFVYYNESIYVGQDDLRYIAVLFLGNEGKMVVENRSQTVKQNSRSICLIPRPGFQVYEAIKTLRRR